MSAPEGAPATPAKRGRGRWFKLRVVLAVLVLVIGFTLYLNWRNGLPPTVVGTLGSGHGFVDVPLAAFYTPNLSVPGFSTTANVSLAATPSFATHITFTWTDVRGTSLPVQLVFVPTPGSNSPGEAFGPGPSNGFLYYLDGVPAAPVTLLRTTYGTVAAGADGLVWATWRVNYSAREMSVHDWLRDDHWVEVEYSITPVLYQVGSMPAANVSHPQRGDLQPIGGPLRVSYQAGFPWSYSWTIHNVPMPPGPFTRTVGSVAFNAGSAGTVGANLTASFQWGPNDNNEVQASGSGPANLSLQVYVDMRFGSLLVESLA